MPIKDKLFKLYPIKRGGRFFNPREIQKNGSLLSEYVSSLRSLFHEIAIFWKSFINWKRRFPKNYRYWIDNNKNIIKSSIQPSITWIGHATFLIQIDGINILTDPIFGNVTFLFQRIFEPAISLNKLPKIDYVIISHNHLDHMDANSLIALRKLFPEIKFLVPYGDKKWFDKRNFSENTIEFNWWDTYRSNNNTLKFTFLPAYHWSQRGLFDQNKSLWGSWMIQAIEHSIFFAGDTGYSEHFNIIANEFPKIDIALMPIGPCEPRDKMCNSHISAEEAGKAFIELKANHFIPMHWGTFYFGIDFFDTPIIRLLDWWSQNSQSLIDKTLNIVKFGQRLEFITSINTVSLNTEKAIENTKL